MKRFLPMLALAAAAAGSPAWGFDDGQRRAGDLLSYALPLGSLAVELGRGDRTGAWQLTRSFAVTMAATEVLKKTVAVERPDGSDDESFPSGHASRAFSAAAYVHRRHGFESALPLYAAATYVGYTRVQARRHRWIDVIGSAALAIACTRALVEPIGAGTPAAGVPGGARRGIWLALQAPL